MDAISACERYGRQSVRAVRKRLLRGESVVFHRTHTPAPDKQAVLYMYALVDGDIGWYTYTILEGAEGDAFARRMSDERTVSVIHSHAINRFILRRLCHEDTEEYERLTSDEGRYRKVQRYLLRNLASTYPHRDRATDEFTTYFDGGLFLGVVEGDVWRFKTFIMNRQCGQYQRMQSLTSEQAMKRLVRNLRSDSGGNREIGMLTKAMNDIK